MSKLYFRVASDWQEVVRLRTEISKLESQIRSMDVNKAPQAVAVLNKELVQSKQQLRGMVEEASKAGIVMENDLKKKIYQSLQSVNDFTQKIINQKAVIKDVEADVKRLGESYRSALKNNPLFASSKLSEYTSAKKALDEEKASLFGLTQEQANARLSVKKLRDEYSLYRDESKETIQSNDGVGISLKKAFAVIGGAAAGKELISNIIRVRGEFQAADTAIQTLLGSKEKANTLMSQVKEYAKISPLEFSDVTQATQVMLGFNIEAEKVPQYLRAIGDISMGETGKFNSLTLAFSQMSATGKLMGQDLNQMINAGFNPLQQISDTTGKSIATLKNEMSKGAISAEMVQKAFLDATSAGGKFFGMSENASKTINGQLSMMQDAIDSTFNELGEKSEGAIMGGIQLTTKLVENYETVGKILSGLVITYGAYRTAVMLSTIATGKHTIAEVTLTNVRVVARKAQMALNASMLANPYVLLTTAVVGLGTAMWVMSDNTNAAARAQKEYNEIKDTAAKKEKEHKQKIEELLSAARDESLATLTRQKSLEELRKEYPKIFEKYDIEKLKLTDILELKRQINEEDSNRSVKGRKEDYSSLKETVANQRRYLQLFDNPDLRKSMSEKDKSIWKIFAGNQSYVQVREEMEKNASRLKLLQKDIIEDNLSSYKFKLKKYSKEKLEAELKMAQSSASKRNGFNVGGIMVKGDDLDSIISSINGELAERKSPTTYKQDYEKAKKEWEDAKKALSEIEKDKSNFTSKQYEEAKKRSETAEKAYKDLGGITGSSLTKQESAAEKLRKQQESIREQKDKNAQLDKKQSLDRIRQQQDLDNQAVQAEIDAMSESFEKKEKQRELNNKKEIQSLERQKEDYINAVIQIAKDKFDSEEELNAKQKKGYIKQTFDSYSVKVDTSVFDGIIGNTSKKQLNDKVREQEDSWNEYLIKFGNYQQKRAAIIEKYDNLIKNADAGKAAIYEKDKQNAVDELDNSIKNSTTLMGQLFADASKKSASEIQKIIEKTELLMQYIGAVKDEQGNAQIGGKTVSKKDILGLGISENTLQNLEMSAEEVEALRNAIDRLKGDLGSKSPFLLFKSQIKEAVDKLNQGGKKNIAQGITEIGEAVASFSPAISQFGQDLGNIVGSDDLGNKIAGISDAIGGLGQTAAGVGQIMSGDIVGGAMSAVSGISSVVSALDGLFGADYSHYNEMKEQYDTLNSIWDELIDKKKEYINTSYGIEANKAGKEALDLAQKSIESYRLLGRERLNAGASAGSHSIGVRIRKGMSKEGWNEAKQALGGDFNKFGIGDGRMTGLFDLSVEQLEKLKMGAPTFWAKLDGDVRDYLNNIIQGAERIEDIQEQVKEQLTQVSFDSVFDSFVDVLMDMDSSAEDFADNFEEYMQRAILTTMVGDKYRSKLQAWYDNFAKSNDDEAGITKDEMDKSQKEWDDIVSEAVSERDKLKDLFGWTGESSSTSQSSTSRGFGTEMTHEDAGELNGRFAALQVAGESILAQNSEHTMSLKDLSLKAGEILTVNTEIRNIADDTRDLIANSYLELQEIRENTGAIVKPIIQMQKDMAEVKKNTSKL